MYNCLFKKSNKIKPENLQYYLINREVGIKNNINNCCFVCKKKHIFFRHTPLMSKKLMNEESEIGWKVKCGSKNRYRWEFVCSKDCVNRWLNENRLVSQYSYFPIIE